MSRKGPLPGLRAGVRDVLHAAGCPAAMRAHGHQAEHVANGHRPTGRDSGPAGRDHGRHRRPARRPRVHAAIGPRRDRGRRPAHHRRSCAARRARVRTSTMSPLATSTAWLASVRSSSATVIRCSGSMNATSRARGTSRSTPRPATPSLRSHHRVAPRAGGFHLAGRVTAVHLGAFEYVAQGVQVAGRHARRGRRCR